MGKANRRGSAVPRPSPAARGSRAVRAALLAAAFLPMIARHASGQEPDTADGAGLDLQPLAPYVVLDPGCAIDSLRDGDQPAPRDTARRALGALAAAPPVEGTYFWFVSVPATLASPDSQPTNDVLAPPDVPSPGETRPALPDPVVYDHRGRRTEPAELYEAERLVILVETPLPRDPREIDDIDVRAGTAVRRQEGLLARGFPYLLGELLAAVLPRTGREARGCGAVAVRRHLTPIGVPDATVWAQLDVWWSATEAREDVLAEFRRRRVEIEAQFLGYTDLRVVIDRLEAVLGQPACRGGAAADCSFALREAAVQAVAELAPTAEHRIRALQQGTASALDAIEALLGARRWELGQTFRVVRRPWIGFSVGGLLAEEASDQLELEVEDGLVVADGVEGDGFKSLVLLDLYLRPVDIGRSAPGIVPHLSVGFTIGDVLQPGLFAASTLPFTAGRLAPFAGVILRRETEDATGADGEPAIDEDRRLRWVFGLKVGLPIHP